MRLESTSALLRKLESRSSCELSAVPTVNEVRLAKDSIMMENAPLCAAERDRTRRTLLHEHDQRADVAGAKLTSVTHAHT